MSGLRILVAGGAGFIGTVLVHKLCGLGHELTIFDKRPTINPPCRAIIGDVRDLAALTEAVRGHDVIYNLAAEHRDDVHPLNLYEEVNVGGARNVCEAAARTGIACIVFTSSVAVYGDSPTELTEDRPHNWINEYGRTKSLAEEVYCDWQRAAPDRRLMIVRPTVVFGPRNRGNVFNLVNQIGSGRFLMIGSGTNCKSMAYIDNVADYLVHILAQGSGVHIWNYTDKPDFNMNELVAFVRSEFGHSRSVGLCVPSILAAPLGVFADVAAGLLHRNLPISSVRIKKFQANTQIAGEKAFATGFKPQVGLKEGLRRMIKAEFGTQG